LDLAGPFAFSSSVLRGADGFLLRKATPAGDTWYDYSARGELLRVDLPDGRAIEYVTDPLGRRIAKKIDGVIVEKYLWQGLTRLLAVYDGAGALLQRFEYADGRMPVATTRAGVRYYLVYDQVGSLRAVVDGAGNVVKRVDYDSFGNVLFDSDAGFAAPFGFAGGLYDSDTELTRFGYRDYDADTGRWTAKDPIGFAGVDTDLYGYCLNDGVNWVDPMRLITKKRIGEVALGIVSIVEGIQTLGIGVAAIGATAIGTLETGAACPVLTSIVVIEVLPVFGGAYLKIQHGVELIIGHKSHSPDSQPLGPPAEGWGR